jgi:bifunctional DNA-binding transcriptional regulator/antitoxin component of YhaV-PrlF toxin-antitoxin module
MLVRIATADTVLEATRMAEAIQVMVDQQGRLTLPHGVHKRLGLMPGMTLVVEAAEQGQLRLRARPEADTLVEKCGLLVLRGEPTEDLSGVVERHREQRLAEVMGRGQE